MIIDEYRPTKSLYYIGAIVLAQMPKDRAADIVGLYRQAARILGRLTFARYMLALDWLFIIGLLDVDESGDLTRVS